MSTYLHQLFNLEGRVAAVTGAGGHLCSEMARGFARAGCAVAVLDLRLEKAQAVEAELRAEGFDKVMAMAVDVSKKEQTSEPLLCLGGVQVRRKRASWRSCSGTT